MGTATASNTEYIASLKYRLDSLLALELEPSVQPERPHREHTEGKVILCQQIPHKADSKLSEHALLDSSTGAIWPGALVKEDHTLAKGRPTPYVFPRGPLKIHVGLPGLGAAGSPTIDAPTNVSVPDEIQRIIGVWFTDVKDKEGYKPMLEAFSLSHKSFTKQQIGIDLGFGAQWGGNAATMGMKVDSTFEETVVYRAFRQVYYRVYIEQPDEAGDLFLPEVVLDKNNMPATAPPGLVREVAYGRIIIVQMISKSKSTTQDAEATLDFIAGGVTPSAKLKEHYEKIASESTFKALVLGGGTEESRLLCGDAKEMNAAIRIGIEFSKSNPAFPVAYKVEDLKSREDSVVQTTTDYVEDVWTVLPDPTITIKHEGAYVAWFKVSWKEPDESGRFVSKSWKCSYKSAGYEHSITFPGDAKDFVVTATNQTGLAWDQHHTKTVRYGRLSGDKKITFSGTTLDMKVSH